MGNETCETCGCIVNDPHQDYSDCIAALGKRVHSMASRERIQAEKLRRVMEWAGIDPDIGEP